MQDLDFLKEWEAFWRECNSSTPLKLSVLFMAVDRIMCWYSYLCFQIVIECSLFKGCKVYSSIWFQMLQKMLQITACI